VRFGGALERIDRIDDRRDRVAFRQERPHQRGQEKDVVIIVWGEFGRSPRINKDAGRDHWLPAMSALVAGGGLKMGQVIGSTDARGEFPRERPYKIANVLATLYHAIGIDPATTFRDGTGRPLPLVKVCPGSMPIVR
jgi:uncharacterized protein (DUF1501 family)